MSKTLENKVLKAKTLAEGIQKHYDELSKHGIKKENLSKLISESEKALERDKKVEELRLEVSENLYQANLHLANAKEVYQEFRAIIKNNYPLEKWSQFGLMDKR